MEYLAQIPNLSEPTRLAYTREASRHVARDLLNPRKLLDIFMNVVSIMLYGVKLHMYSIILITFMNISSNFPGFSKSLATWREASRV